MKPIYILVLVIITTNCFAQKDRKLSFYLSLQADAAMYDNAVFYQSRGLGLGAGLQINFNTKTMFKPTLEINADCFTGFVKPIGLPPGTEYVEFTPGVMSPYMGLFVLPLKWFFFATTFGPSFYNNKAHFGIRPSIGFYPTQRKKCSVKVSFTNIFQHYNKNNKSLGYFSFVFAAKLY